MQSAEFRGVDICSQAIDHVGNSLKSLVDKIVIARNFAVSTWPVPFFNALVQREKPLYLSEGDRLGSEWALDRTLSSDKQAYVCRGQPEGRYSDIDGGHRRVAIDGNFDAS